MFRLIRHWQQRELRFLGLIAFTGLVIALHLDSGLRLLGQEGSGWRRIDLQALQQRIETGELTDREAEWYHTATPEEVSSAEGMP